MCELSQSVREHCVNFVIAYEQCVNCAKVCVNCFKVCVNYVKVCHSL